MKKIVFIISCLFLLYPATGQLRLSVSQGRRLDSIAVQDVPDKAPGIATAIIQNGKVLYKKYAGYANLTDSVLINPQTRFNIASNGKQFTALAMLVLQDAGKLKLSDDIRNFFPELYPSVKEKITLEHLVTHTSGIRDCYDLWNLQGYTWWEKNFSNRDVLELVQKQQSLNFKPGTQYLYSNTNYILLALIIEKTAGKNFVAFMNELFKKLGMPNTSFEDDYTKIRGPIARAYFNFGSWTTYNWIWNVCGDGNLFSTLEDQVQWEKLLHGKARSIIKTSILKKSQQPVNDIGYKQYGYGVEFGIYKGMPYTFHEGATGAWKATVIRFPSQKISCITLTNTGKSIPYMQTRQMADILFSLKSDAAYLVTRPAQTGKFVPEEAITGIYLTDNDFAFEFEKRNGSIFLKRNGRNDVELEREAANIFHQKFDTAFKQEFTENEKGILQVTAYYINHSPYTLIKQTSEFTGFMYEKLNGKFINAETGATLHIQYSSGKNYNIKISTGNITTGLLISTNKMIVDNYSILFNETPGDINELFLSGERIKEVRFEKQKE